MVEEPSAEAFFRALIPRFWGDISFQVYPFQGKNDLLKNLPLRLRGYSKWLPSNCRILVVVDRDQDDCVALKDELDEAALRAGLVTKTTAGTGPFQVINRIAVEELESWYFGDWEAVRFAYPKVPSSIPQKARYRDPDAIEGGTWEALERIFQRAGYFIGGLRKVELARTLGPLIYGERNRSGSFQALCEALNSVSRGSSDSSPI